MLLCLMILSAVSALVLSLFVYVKKDMEVKGSIDEMEWEVFLGQLKKDAASASGIHVHSSGITFFFKDKAVIVEKYQDKIRRRVDGTGHEILLQNISSFQAVVETGGLTIKAGDKMGFSMEGFLWVMAGGP
ncbi:competence type IV pilus minor pilin ComGF [Peribacillus sp. SCS-26]|uniref:competence type IV pilus minor pilin ComGF n=1 Tax=Paraperibacillus marinus TaxID=3115295 RepID=UPI003905767E